VIGRRLCGELGPLRRKGDWGSGYPLPATSGHGFELCKSGGMRSGRVQLEFQNVSIEVFCFRDVAVSAFLGFPHVKNHGHGLARSSSYGLISWIGSNIIRLGQIRSILLDGGVERDS
jgi:hypothetical protein